MTAVSARAAWKEVEQRLLDQVFYAADPADVIRAEDLGAAGLLDSLSIVAILEVLAESAASDDVLGRATAEDFRNLATIRALYEGA